MKNVKHILGLLDCVEKTKKYMKEEDPVGLKDQLNIAKEKNYDQDEVYKG